MSPINIDHLNIIVGEQLSSVTFIQDYLQLDFDRNTLTCYDWPKININGKTFLFDENEYRNMLCKFITENVIKVNSSVYDVSILFDVGSITFVMLDDKEVIYFNDAKKKWSYYPYREK